MILFQSSIAGSVPLGSFGVHALETVNRRQYPPLSVLVIYVLVSVGLYFPTTSTPTSTTTRTTRTATMTESYDGGSEDGDDESCSWEGGWGGRT